MYRVLAIALFAVRISTQILMLRSPLDTIANGFNHGVGSAVTSSMRPSFSNLLSSSFALLCKAKGIRRSVWATCDTDRSI